MMIMLTRTSILQAEDIISSENISIFPSTFEVENEDYMTRGQISV